jgi:Flp pilus assembly pilin Flp
MKKLMNTFVKYLKKENGLVTIEWAGIAAVVVLAAVVITASIMHSVSDLGSAVIKNIDTTTENVSAP